MNKMNKIAIYTNLVWGGWSAENLNKGVGGTEETIIILARTLAKMGWDVTIFHNGKHGVFDGVSYKDFDEFDQLEHYNVFLSVKNAGILNEYINADKVLFWTTDIRANIDKSISDYVDQIICISDYHKKRFIQSNDVNPKKVRRLHLGVDFKELDSVKCDKESNTMLYSSSYDRGLEELLTNWITIKEKLKLEKLYITYGWDFLLGNLKHNPSGMVWKKKMDKLMQQDGIVHLGRLSREEMHKMYWKSTYWCLPLNNPDGELFCLNAVKAEYCNAIPIIKIGGGLYETVDKYVDFNNISDIDADTVISQNRGHVVSKFNLDDIIKEWIKILAQS